MANAFDVARELAKLKVMLAAMGPDGRNVQRPEDARNEVLAALLGITQSLHGRIQELEQNEARHGRAVP